MDDTRKDTTPNFTLTQSAVDRVAVLLADDTQAGGGEAHGGRGAGGGQDMVFRVAILGGGCSGFQYSFEIEPAAQTAPDDRLLDFTASDGTPIKVAVDSMSLGMLAGSELDFARELIGNYFRVSNPNATASCGCGTSFAL